MTKRENNTSSKIRSVVLFFTALICCGVIGWSYIGVILPIREQLVASRQVGQQLARELTAQSIQQVSLENDIAELPALRDRLNSWRMQMILQPDVPRLLQEMAKMGKASHLHFRAFILGNVLYEKWYATLPLSVEMTGEYAAMANFIEQMAELPWIVSIKQFDVTRQSKGNRYTCHARFEIYLSRKI